MTLLQDPKIKPMKIEDKLKELKLTLPTPPPVAGNYLPYVRTGNLLYLAGSLCMLEGQMTHTGKVGKEQTIETAYLGAQVCALNTLMMIKMALGSLDLVKKIVFIGGFVNGIEGFAESPAVINGASDLLVKIFGELGKHARTAVSVAGLPKNSTVEIQCIVEV